MSGRSAPTAHAGPSVSALGPGIPRRCVIGVDFLTTAIGILNIVIMVAILCALISAAIVAAPDAAEADSLGQYSAAKVGAVATRNAVIAFAVIALILLVADTIFHATSFIKHLPASYDLIIIIVMLVIGGIYLILGCCAAAWEQKMRDTLGLEDRYTRSGAPASAAFFLFVSMILIFVNFILRLVKPEPPPPL